MKDSKELLAASAREGWRAALPCFLGGESLERALNPERASFHELIPLPDSGEILVLEAGWGGIAAEWARKHRVLAFASDPEQVRFLELRATQDGLQDRLEARQGGVESFPLHGRRFDAVILDGCPWDAFPPALQQDFLRSLREALQPEGFLYLGARNRRALRRGEPAGPGATTYAGYVRRFQQAGLKVHSAYVSPRGYGNPSELVPLQRQAIRHYTRMRLEPAGENRRQRLLNLLKLAGATEGVWRTFSSDFVFLLGLREAPHA